MEQAKREQLPVQWHWNNFSLTAVATFVDVSHGEQIGIAYFTTQRYVLLSILANPNSSWTRHSSLTVASSYQEDNHADFGRFALRCIPFIFEFCVSIRRQQRIHASNHKEKASRNSLWIALKNEVEEAYEWDNVSAAVAVILQGWINRSSSSFCAAITRYACDESYGIGISIKY